MKFYVNKGKNSIELISIAFFIWAIGFLIFFLGGLFLSEKIGIIESHEKYEKKVKEYAKANVQKPKDLDFNLQNTGSMNANEITKNYKQARENYEKDRKEYSKKTLELEEEHREKNPIKSFDPRYIILLVGILPLILTVFICKKYYDNLTASIEIIDNSIILTKRNRKTKSYKLEDYFVQLYVVTVFSWKHLFIPYKLYSIKLLDERGKHKEEIYLSDLFKKDLEAVLNFIEEYQKKYQI